MPCYNSITMATYQDEFTALKYLDFLNSYNGQLQQHFLFEAILPKIPKNPPRFAPGEAGHGIKILDAGCGSGWLSGELKKHYPDVSACDASEFFIKFAKANYNGIKFKVASLDRPLPYPHNCFDVAILNMVAPDLEKLEMAFKNLAPVIRPSGKLLMTIPNPKYTYPAAEWKRSVLDVLLGRKPGLKIKNPPLSGEKIQREFGKDVKIKSYYYSLVNYITAAKSAHLELRNTAEIRSEKDSADFNLAYQLHRYPLLLLLEFEKLG